MTTNVSTWIRWPGHLAWVFLVLIPIAVFAVRGGAWQQGLLLYAIACLVSLLLLTLFAIQSLLPRFGSQRKAIFQRALPAIPGAALLVMILTGPDVPPIHDISTDTDDPPHFEAVPTLRDPGSNPLDIDPAVVEQQLSAYPNLDTFRTSRRYEDTYTAALATARELGWEIVRDDLNAGFIEAVDTTALMNFRDDVVIRVRTSGRSSLVDLRSASRVGISDLGTNAARIERFLKKLKANLES